MSGSACPSDEILDAFFLDTLPDVARSEIRAHVSACNSCQQRAATVPGVARPSQQPTREISTASAPLTRGTLVGRYVILQLLGAGAMGFVYEAVDPELERKVALKLLRTSHGKNDSRVRLLREAQAMARLSHPNVVPVFDVGATESGDVFVAMERVDGETLSEWCRRQTDWRQLLLYFLYAGRGLAAAHAAGLIHRDFKPHNVLVAKDGRVRVTDFGLVRLLSDAEVLASRETLPPKLLGEPLTRDGAILGTPHYMSPEQLSGEKVDARSDQFSFCVALYEALYKERPFAGERLHELLAHQQLNKVRDAPAGTRVPGWVRKALLVGLRYAPSERYPSMDALFAAMEKDPARKWKRAALGTGAALVLAAGALGGLAQLHRPSACASAGRAIESTWTKADRDRVAATFDASGKSFSRDAFRALDEALSRYVRRGATAARSSCEAARVEERTPLPVYTRQTTCFERRANELSSFVELLAHADPSALADAWRSVDALPSFEACTRADAVATLASPAEALYPDEAKALSAALANITAQNALGQYTKATSGADEALKRAPHLGESPLAAQLEEVRARAAFYLDHFPESSAAFDRVALLGERFGDDATAADAWIGRANVELALAHYPEAKRALALARAKLDRIGAAPEDVENRWQLTSAMLAYDEGRYQDAATTLRKRLADVGPKLTPLDKANLYERLGDAENQLGEKSAAANDFQQSVSITESALGPKHPALASRLGSLALTKQHAGDFAAARQLFERALAIDDDALGPDSLEASRVLNNLALLDGDVGDPEGELALLRRSRAIKERVLGPNHPSVAVAWVNEAAALVPAGHLPEAETALGNAAKIMVASYGPDHPNLSAVYNNLGTVQRNQKRYAEAESSFRKAAEIAEKRLGAQHPWLASALYGLGLDEISLEHLRAAQSPLERALAIDEAIGASDTDIAEAKFTLAEALWVTPSQRHRALTLASEAMAVARKTPLPDGPTMPDMELWFRQHRAIFNAPGR